MLRGHALPVVGLAGPPAGDWLVSSSVDTRLQVWDLAQVEFDAEALRTSLFEATTACLTPDQRERDLAESPTEASAALAACDARYRP